MSESLFKFKSSRIYAAILATVYLLSASIVMMMSLYIVFKLTLFVLLTGYLFVIAKRYCYLISPLSIVSIKPLSRTRWLLYTPNDNYEAELLGDSVITGVLSVLRFKVADKRRPMSAMVFRDSLEGDGYRKLVAQLRAG